MRSKAIKKKKNNPCLKKEGACPLFLWLQKEKRSDTISSTERLDVKVGLHGGVMAKKQYFKVREDLIDIISTQKLAGNRLPPEANLAKRLKVSRGTVREALQTLAKEGIISKKHGLGNFIHRSAIETKMRIDSMQDFYDIIESGGYQARMEKIGKSEEVLIEDSFFAKITEILHIKDKKELVTLQSIYYADDEPAIYSQVYIPRAIILDDPDKTVKQTLFHFLTEFCNQTVEQTIIKFLPINSNQLVSSILNVPQNTSLIQWEEYYYNIYDEVICVALTFFNPKFMELAMLRKADEDQAR